MNISNKTVIGLGAFLLFAFILSSALLMHYAERKTRLHHAEIMSGMVVEQVNLVRDVYFKEVIGKLKKDGYGADLNYQSKKGHVPIAATFIRKLGNKSTEDGFESFSFSPVSKWNIGVGHGVQEDANLAKAWDALTEQYYRDPDKDITFTYISKEQGNETFNHVTPIKAIKARCVVCHNHLEQSEDILTRRELNNTTPRILKVGDMIGALHVKIPMSKASDASVTQIEFFAYILAIFTIIGSVVTFILIKQNKDTSESLKSFEHDAHHDALTGLLNRRGYEARIAELRHTPGLHYKTHAVFIDLDGFKLANDTYGHDAGDYILEQVASYLKHITTSQLVVARRGGDEFVLLLTDTDKDHAYETVITIFEMINQSDYLFNDDHIKIGCSIGLATFKRNEDFNHFLTRADKACYKAKEEGKNKIYTSSGVNDDLHEIEVNNDK